MTDSDPSDCSGLLEGQRLSVPGPLITPSPVSHSKRRSARYLTPKADAGCLPCIDQSRIPTSFAAGSPDHGMGTLFPTETWAPRPDRQLPAIQPEPDNSMYRTRTRSLPSVRHQGNQIRFANQWREQTLTLGVRRPSRCRASRPARSTTGEGRPNRAAGEKLAMNPARCRLPL